MEESQEPGPSTGRIRARCSSHYGRDANLHYKRGGPSKFQEFLAERSFLRRLYNGLRIDENCPIVNGKAIYLTIFSPDGTKIAATNENHDIHIICANKKTVLSTLSGHSGIPWTLAFHPSDSNILASGCLAGEVRVWDLKDNTCKVWHSPDRVSISSLDFHSKEKMLAIATCKYLIFLDWSTLLVLSQVETENDAEQVRYVKFASAGDKLITAISLKNDILSQSDAINVREIHSFNCSKEMLFDFQRICEFLKKQIPNCRNFDNVVDSDSNDNDFKPKIRRLNQRRSCPIHFSMFQNCVNVSSFCPTEFSINMIKALKSNTTLPKGFNENCDWCKYSWLYDAVFKCQMIHEGENLWNFTDSRKEELLTENEDKINGLTEDLLRYSFEQYARIIIAPEFARTVPGSVSKKCIDVDHIPAYRLDEHFRVRRLVFYHDIILRSDRFLWQFPPASGSFSCFFVSFAATYQTLASFQKICSKIDEQKLNTIMMEWEYLYSKMRLICKVMEGDERFLFSKRPNCPTTNQKTDEGMPPSSHLNSSELSYSYYKMLKFIQRNEEVTEEQFNDHLKTDSECKFCKPLEVGGASDTSESIKRLNEELNEMTKKLSQLYDGKTQHDRIMRQYRDQADHTFNRKGSARIHTIHIVRKCILLFLSDSVWELKRSLKQNLDNSSLIDHRCRESYIRMMVFMTKKTIWFCNLVFDFVCNIDYSVSELVKELDPEYTKMNAGRNLFSLLRMDDALKTLKKENHPVFDEERETDDSDLWDDELSSNAKFAHEEALQSDNKFGQFRRMMMFCPDDRFMSRGSPAQETAKRKAHARKSGGVVCSNTHLDKHLKLLEVWDSPWNPFRECDRLQAHVRHQLIVTTNAEVLYEFFYRHLTLASDVGEDDARASSLQPLHRLQMWDVSGQTVPNISSRTENLVVTECRVHGDATIAISHDQLRVAALLTPNQCDHPHLLGIFSLEWNTLGHILYAVSLSKITVALSFSPTDDYLAVGYNYTYMEDIKMGDVVEVRGNMSAWRDLDRPTKSRSIETSIVAAPMKKQHVYSSTTVFSINWIPGPGQGLIVGNTMVLIQYWTVGNNIRAYRSRKGKSIRNANSTCVILNSLSFCAVRRYLSDIFASLSS